MQIALTAALFLGILTLWVESPWAIHAQQAAVFTLALILAARAFRRPSEFRLPPPLWILAACPLWAAVQLLAGSSVYPFATLGALLRWAAALSVAAVASHCLRDDAARRAFLRALLAFGFILGVISILQLVSSPGRVFWIFPTPYSDWVLGPFVYRNNYAAFVELVFPIALLWLFRARNLLLACLVAGTLYASVVASASRAGAVLVTLELLVLVAYALRSKRYAGMRRGRRLGLAAAALVALTLVAGPGLLLSRFFPERPFDAVRPLLAKSTLAMALDRPLLGFGLGTWTVAYPAYAAFDIGLFANHAHNEWLQWAAEGGCVPFFSMLALFLFIARAAFRSPWALGLVAVFLHSLVDYPFLRQGLALLIFALAASVGQALPPAKK